MKKNLIAFELSLCNKYIDKRIKAKKRFTALEALRKELVVALIAR